MRQGISFVCDDAGRLLTAGSGRYNNTVAFAYTDGAGRLTSESLAVNFAAARTYTVASQYDAAGHRTGITYPDGSVVTRSYTQRDQLAQIGYNSAMVAQFTYDNNGRRLTRKLGDTPQRVTTYSYSGRLDNLVTSISTPSVISFAYTYDANRNKLTETLGSPMANYGFNSTAYDSEDRLTAWTRHDGQKNQSWNLSLAGDWNSFTENGATQARTHTPVHELTAIGSNALTFDPKGNLTHDNTKSPAQSYTWDFDNRLLSATLGGATASYTYDALGRRVSKTAGGATTVYVCTTRPMQKSPNAGQEVAEYAAGAMASSPQRKYVFAEYIDEPVVMLVPASGGETKYYYHANNLYSVAAITNQAGSVVERYAYTPYGKTLFLNGSGSLLSPQPASSPVGNPSLYTGRRLDSETGLDYYRARYYAADSGRFIGRDPIGIQGGLNLYGYVGGLPLGHIDPNGYYGECGVATPCLCGAGTCTIPQPPAEPVVPPECRRAMRNCSLMTDIAIGACVIAVVCPPSDALGAGFGCVAAAAAAACEDAEEICNEHSKR